MSINIQEFIEREKTDPVECNPLIEKIDNPESIQKIQEITNGIIEQLKLGYGLECINMHTYGFNHDEELFFLFSIVPELEKQIQTETIDDDGIK